MSAEQWIPASGDGIDIKNHPNKAFIGKYKETFTYTGKFGDSKIHRFIDENGLPLAIFGFTALDRYMSQIEPGTWCRMTYTGKVKNKRGQDTHTCTVFIKKGELEKVGVVKDDNSDLPF